MHRPNALNPQQISIGVREVSTREQAGPRTGQRHPDAHTRPLPEGSRHGAERGPEQGGQNQANAHAQPLPEGSRRGAIPAPSQVTTRRTTTAALTRRVQTGGSGCRPMRHDGQLYPHLTSQGFNQGGCSVQPLPALNHSALKSRVGAEALQHI